MIQTSLKLMFSMHNIIILTCKVLLLNPLVCFVCTLLKSTYVLEVLIKKDYVINQFLLDCNKLLQVCLNDHM